MPLFLQKGEIDGFIAWAPHPTSAVTQGIGHVLLTANDILPNHQCCVLSTAESAMQDDSETVKTVLETYCEAYNWFLNNMDETIKMLSKATGVSEDIIRKAIVTVKYPYPPVCNVESMHVIAQSLIDADRITTVETTDLDGFIDSLFRPELLEMCK